MSKKLIILVVLFIVVVTSFVIYHKLKQQYISDFAKMEDMRALAHSYDVLQVNYFRHNSEYPLVWMKYVQIEMT